MPNPMMTAMAHISVFAKVRAVRTGASGSLSSVRNGGEGRGEEALCNIGPLAVVKHPSPRPSPRSCLTGRGRRTRCLVPQSRHELTQRLMACDTARTKRDAPHRTQRVRSSGFSRLGVESTGVGQWERLRFATPWPPEGGIPNLAAWPADAEEMAYVSGSLSSVRNGGEGWGEEALRTGETVWMGGAPLSPTLYPFVPHGARETEALLVAAVSARTFATTGRSQREEALTLLFPSTRGPLVFSPFSLAPGFNRVLRGGEVGSRFNGFGGRPNPDDKARKPLKRLRRFAFPHTRLKPGANEITTRRQATALRKQLAPRREKVRAS